MANIIRVSISEAARLFGTSEKTIRRTIKKQEVSYIVSNKRYKISFESLVKWSQNKTITAGKLSKDGIGQFVDKWKINNVLYSPRPPEDKSAIDKK